MVAIRVAYSNTLQCSLLPVYISIQVFNRLHEMANTLL